MYNAIALDTSSLGIGLIKFIYFKSSISDLLQILCFYSLNVFNKSIATAIPIIQPT